ncbi:MAG: GNAT superfamily N-acetyltransferase [Planctomycetota bacterium]|jgi:GNAT superfamily N-acetyltransferase
MAILKFRKAVPADLAALVAFLADDDLGATREDTSTPLNPRYLEAFDCIAQDANNELAVVESNAELVGMLQLTFIPYLTHTGSKRCLIEGVQIASNYRGQGLGSAFIQWAIEQAKTRQCNLVQLTTDKTRPIALRFYESLGFQATHEGFKLKL